MMRNTTKMRMGLVATLLAFGPAMAVHAGTVGRATCRNGNTDHVETGLQGEVSQADRDSGQTTKGFNCNIDLVGQYQGEGASWQLTAWKNCAYFDQRIVSTGTPLKNPGVIVVDVSNPSAPKMTANLAEPSMLDPWESLKVNPTRQMLAGDQRGGQGIAIYDISKDCAHPQLLSSVNLPGSFGHTGQWAPDGKTYYITPLRSSPSIVVVDTADAANPKLIPCAQGSFGCNASGFFVAPATSPTGATLNPVWHDLEFAKDGNTAYITMASGAANGLLLLDVSDFQQRKANPAMRIISTLTWDDGSRGAQNALPISIKGKQYILFTDESGGGASATLGCGAGKSPYGFARLIDISDPANPKTAGKMMLDMNDPALCAKIMASPNTVNTGTLAGGQSNSFGYSSHYCNVDDADNATLAACSYFSAGWRFFDIRDPNNPREVAYYKPPAQGTRNLLGSQYSNSVAAGFSKPADWATSKASFPKDRGVSSGDIWITSQDNGFMVVHLDQGGGGCTSAEGSLGGLVVLAVAQLIRRRKAARCKALT